MNKKVISTIIGFIFLSFGTPSFLHGESIFDLLTSMLRMEKDEKEVLKKIKTLNTNEINTISSYGTTPLESAAHSNDRYMDVFKYLLSKSSKETINHNADDKYSYSALYLACYGAAKGKVLLLLDKGAKVEQRCIDMVEDEIERIEKKNRPQVEPGDLESYKIILDKLKKLKTK
jgi:ankyrin repeat protein